MKGKYLQAQQMQLYNCVTKFGLLLMYKRVDLAILIQRNVESEIQSAVMA